MLRLKTVFKNLKFSFLLLLVMLTQGYVMAQERAEGFKLQGIVWDSLSDTSLPYATVMLFDEKTGQLWGGGVTDDQGIFILEKVPDGTYQLKIEYLGYNSKSVGPIVVSAQDGPVDLGKITVSESTTMLEGVTLTGDREVIENQPDRLVYHAKKDVEMISGAASDLLRRVPMLTVDIDGNVALRGNGNVTILIDGKLTGGANGDLLQSLPADQVERVEVITSPSARYDADGSAGVINIITKRKALNGTNGAVSIGMGTRQVLGNVGVTTKHNKLLFDVKAGIFNKWPRLVDVTFQSDDANGNRSSSLGQSDNTRLSNSTSAFVQYDFDDQNSVSSTFRRTGLGYNDEMNAQNSNMTEGSSINYTLDTDDKIRNNGFSWNADYIHSWSKTGAEFRAAGQWLQNTDKREYTSKPSDYFEARKADSKATNDEFTAQADYKQPIGEYITVEGGGKMILRDIESINDFYTLGTGGSALFDPVSSNEFVYNQDVYAGYALVHVESSKGLSIEFGSRVEFTEIEGQSYNEQAGEQAFSNSYLNYLPSFTLAKSLNKGQVLKLNYNQRIQRPNLYHINPFREANNPLNQSEGNPSLSPETVQMLELGYNTYIGPVSVNASLYYNRTDDIIESFVETVRYQVIDDSGNVSERVIALSSFENIGYNNAFGVDVFSGVSIRKNLELRGSINVFTYSPRVYPEFDNYLNSGTFLQHSGFASASYKLSGKTRFEAFYSFQSKVRTFQGTRANLNILNLAIKRDIFKDNGAISFVVVNPFENKWDFTDRIQTAQITRYNNLSVPFRSFNLKCSCKFGNGQAKASKKRGVINDDLKKSN